MVNKNEKCKVCEHNFKPPCCEPKCNEMCVNYDHFSRIYKGYEWLDVCRLCDTREECTLLPLLSKVNSLLEPDSMFQSAIFKELIQIREKLEHIRTILESKGEHISEATKETDS